MLLARVTPGLIAQEFDAVSTVPMSPGVRVYVTPPIKLSTLFSRATGRPTVTNVLAFHAPSRLTGDTSCVPWRNRKPLARTVSRVAVSV